MIPDTYDEEGEDGIVWLTSRLNGISFAACRQVDGLWYVAEDDGFAGEIGPFTSMNELISHMEKHQPFGPLGNPGA